MGQREMVCSKWLWLRYCAIAAVVIAPAAVSSNRMALQSAETVITPDSLTARLASQIDELREQCPIVKRGRVGFKFAAVDTGEVLAASDANTFFTPASNTKLYTTACALERLGVDYKFRTELRTTGAWKPGQTRIPDLQLIGGGDPDLSGRAVPYQADADDHDPLRVLRVIADQLYTAGVREIAGNITAVAARYPGDLFPDGWTLDDSDYSYGAPISAMTVNDSTATLVLRPAEAGELAAVEVRPGGSHFLISNQVITVAGKESHIEFSRPGHSNEIVLTGTIGDAVDQWSEDLAVDAPALWAAECFASVLRERGITVAGGPAAEYGSMDAVESPQAANGTLILVHQSAPLSQVVQVVNKVSQNLHAEMLLREVAVVSGQPGTLENGLKIREAFLQQAEITPEGSGFALADGSGLARQDLTTPESTVRLLRYMWGRPERDVWLRSLPVGAIDGSLKHRFKRLPGAQRVHAKTGSISHVNALSGYIETRTRGWLAFSIMVNGTVGPAADVRDFIDRLCALFAEL